METCNLVRSRYYRIFLCKLFGERDKSLLFIVSMSYLTSNISSSVSYGSVFSEFLGIARCTLRPSGFIPRSSELYLRRVAKKENKNKTSQQIKKVFQ